MAQVKVVRVKIYANYPLQRVMIYFSVHYNAHYALQIFIIQTTNETDIKLFMDQ